MVGTLRFAHPTISPLVIASEAKQSISPRTETWIALSLTLLAMTGGELPQLPPCPHRKHADDFVAAHHHHLVHHVDDDAHVIGDDAHDIADIGARVAAGKVEETVLFGEFGDLRLGMFEDQAMAFEA